MSACQGCGATLPPPRGGPPRKWCSDRCRKAQYAGTCIGCGGPTDGSNGVVGQPERCLDCRSRYQHEQARWTPQAIVQAIREWAAEHDGEPPAAHIWGRRHDNRAFPWTAVVLRSFGTWNAAIRAAGFEPRPVGRPRRERSAA